MPRIGTISKQEPTSPRLFRRKETIKEPEIVTRGGFIKNPPQNCQYKCHAEGNTSLWADLAICAFFCANAYQCPLWIKYETLPKEYRKSVL